MALCQRHWALSLNSCVILGLSLNLFESQFHHFRCRSYIDIIVLKINDWAPSLPYLAFKAILHRV